MMIFAIDSGSLNAAHALLLRGANVESCSVDGKTALTVEYSALISKPQLHFSKFTREFTTLRRLDPSRSSLRRANPAAEPESALNQS